MQPSAEVIVKETTVVVHSFDWDGSLFSIVRAIKKKLQAQLDDLTTLHTNHKINSTYDMNKNEEIKSQIQDLQKEIIIAINKSFIQKLKKQIANAPHIKHIGIFGSNRQSTGDDCANFIKKYDENNKYTVGSGLALIKWFSKEQLGIDFHEFLMPDLNLDGDTAHELGFTYQESLKKNETADPHPEDRAPSWDFDNHKITLLYAQMQTIAKQNPEEEIIFNFYDDTGNILSSLKDFYTKHPEFIPANVTLKLNHYDGKLNKREGYRDPCEIAGNGLIDTDCRATIKELVQNRTVQIPGFNQETGMDAFLKAHVNQYVYNMSSKQLFYVNATSILCPMTENLNQYTTKIKEKFYLTPMQIEALEEMRPNKDETVKMYTDVNILSATDDEITQIGIKRGLNKPTIPLDIQKKEKSQPLPSAQIAQAVQPQVHANINTQPVAQVPSLQADHNPAPKRKIFKLTSMAALDAISKTHPWVLEALAHELKNIPYNTMLLDGAKIFDPNNHKNQIHLSGITLLSRRSQSQKSENKDKISFVAIPTKATNLSGACGDIYKSTGTFAIKTTQGSQTTHIKHWSDDANDSKKIVKVMTAVHMKKLHLNSDINKAKRLQANEIAFGKQTLKSTGGHTDTDDTFFIIMKKLNGQDLRNFMNNRSYQPTTYKDKIALYQKVLLAYQQQILDPKLLHRDIKPENIFIEQLEDGAVAGVKLIDFGFAISNTTEETGGIVGTHGYIPSVVYKSFNHTPSVSHDAYALAIVLWEMLDASACEKFQKTRQQVLKKRPYSADQEQTLIDNSFTDSSLRPDIRAFLKPLLSPRAPNIPYDQAKEYWTKVMATFEKIVADIPPQDAKNAEMIAALGLRAVTITQLSQNTEESTALQTQLQSLYKTLSDLKDLYDNDNTKKYYAEKLSDLRATTTSIQTLTQESLVPISNKLASIKKDLETFAERSASITTEIQKIFPNYPKSIKNIKHLEAITSIHQALNNHPDLEINTYTTQLKDISDDNLVKQCKKIVNNIEFQELNIQYERLYKSLNPEGQYEILQTNSTVMDLNRQLTTIKNSIFTVDRAVQDIKTQLQTIHNALHNALEGLDTTFIKNIQKKINVFKKTWWGGTAKASMIEKAVQACPLHLLNYDMFDETKEQPEEVMRVLKALAYKRIGFSQGYNEDPKTKTIVINVETAARTFKEFKAQHNKTNNTKQQTQVEQHNPKQSSRH